MRKNVIETFLDLVQISSPSRNEKAIAKYIRNRMEPLSLEVIEDNCGTKIHGTSGNLIVHIPGKGTPILWDAHMDTVHPCEHIRPVIEKDYIFSDRSSILGADDKSGIAAMICAAEKIIEDHLIHPEIFMVFSVCEEDGLQGVKNLDTSLFKHVKYAFVLDGEGSVGTLTSQTPFSCKGTLEVHGKEAHAGVCPEQGINALKVASEAITKLPIGRVNPNLTCNIGKIVGGTARNVVMGNVSMEFEARGYCLVELKQFVTQFLSVFEKVCHKANAKFKENIVYGTLGYTLKEDDDIVLKFKSLCTKYHFPFKKEACGGASNANIYRMKNIDAICIGTHMKDVHSVQEHIGKQDLFALERLLLALSEEMA